MMGSKTEIIEVAAHELTAIISVQYCRVIGQVIAINLNLMYLLSEGNDGKIDCTASRMARLFRHITVRDDTLFVQIWVKLCLCLVILRLLAPSNKVIDSFLRPIGIVYDK